jgi:hypothetical protein
MGYLKAEVFKHRSRTIEELKEAARQEISEIPFNMLVRVMENFRKRLHMCVARQGNHLDDKKTLLSIVFKNTFFFFILYRFFLIHLGGPLYRTLYSNNIDIKSCKIF